MSVASIALANASQKIKEQSGKLEFIRYQYWCAHEKPAPIKAKSNFYSDTSKAWCNPVGSLHRSRSRKIGVKELPADFFNGLESWGFISESVPKEGQK